jgi:hypothetical protein
LNARFGNVAEGQQRVQARRKLGSSKAAVGERQVTLHWSRTIRKNFISVLNVSFLISIGPAE